MLMSSRQLKQRFTVTVVLVLVLVFLAGINIPKAVNVTWTLLEHKLWVIKQLRTTSTPNNDSKQFFVLKEFNLLIFDTHHSLIRLKEFFNSELPEKYIEQVIDRLHLRAKRLKMTCQYQISALDGIEKANWSSVSRERQLFVNKQHRLMYWAIPKIGSSFWKRIFKVLDSSNLNGEKMFDLTNMEAHIDVPQSIVFLNYHDSEREQMLKSYSKFFFVREPFSRLFSAYVDKLMIPADVGETVTQHMILSGALSNTSCPWQVSFTELCSYVADTILGHKILENHFSPVSVYQPCGFNVTMMGKMETFQEDFRAILYSSNISLVDVVGDVQDVETENEMGYIKDISFRTMRFLVARDHSCISQLDALFRLWKVFRIRGYISKSIKFPFSLKLDGQKFLQFHEFIYAATEAYKLSGSPEVRHKQREEAMLEAYAALPEDILDSLIEALRMDCLLLDYPCNIRDQVKSYRAAGVPSFYFDS